MQDQNVKLIANRSFWYIILVFKFNIVQVSLNRLTTPSFPRLIKSICTKVKSKKVLKS